MGKSTNDELEMVYKTGLKPSEYLANKYWFRTSR